MNTLVNLMKHGPREVQKAPILVVLPGPLESLARLGLFFGLQSRRLPHLVGGGKMATERVQRHINRLLDESEDAAADRTWQIVYEPTSGEQATLAVRM